MKMIDSIDLKQKLHEYERSLLLWALESTDWNVRLAAQRLRLHERTMWHRLVRHGISPSEHRMM